MTQVMRTNFGTSTERYEPKTSTISMATERDEFEGKKLLINQDPIGAEPPRIGASLNQDSPSMTETIVPSLANFPSELEEKPNYRLERVHPLQEPRSRTIILKQWIGKVTDITSDSFFAEFHEQPSGQASIEAEIYLAEVSDSDIP